jgi:hypothetical protein
VVLRKVGEVESVARSGRQPAASGSAAKAVAAVAGEVSELLWPAAAGVADGAEVADTADVVYVSLIDVVTPELCAGKVVVMDAVFGACSACHSLCLWSRRRSVIVSRCWCACDVQRTASQTSCELPRRLARSESSLWCVATLRAVQLRERA